MAGLGIAIAGFGIMGQRMGAAIDARSDMRVVGIYDPNPEKNADTCSIDDLLDRPDLDCLYIASPPATHLALIEAAVSKDIAVLCEKPLATSLAEIADCVGAAAQSKRPAAVNFPFASASAAIRLYNLLAEQRLGDIKRARINLTFAAWPRPWQADAGPWLRSSTEGGFTREVGSHFLWLSQRLFGPGVLVESSVERNALGMETVVEALFDFSGIPVTFDARLGGGEDDRNIFEITGSKSSASITDWYRLIAEGEVDDLIPPTDSQLDELACLLKTGRSRLSTFEEAASVAGLIEEVLA